MTKNRAELKVQDERPFHNLHRLLVYEERRQTEFDRLTRLGIENVHNNVSQTLKKFPLPLEAWHISGHRSGRELLQDAQEVCNTELAKHSQDRNNWLSGSPMRLWYEKSWICLRIEAEVADYHRMAAQRAQEIRNIRNHIELKGQRSLKLIYKPCSEDFLLCRRKVKRLQICGSKYQEGK